MVHLVYKIYQQIKAIVFCHITTCITKIQLWLNGISFASEMKSSGIPILHKSLGASCQIGKNFTMGNWRQLNASGISAKCKIEVRNKGSLIIGDNVGMTATTIMCFNKISIESNTKIGVGVHIYDTDFHNIDPEARLNGDMAATVNTQPIHIGKNVFIGAYSIILKGVTIGNNVIVGAGSVVTKDIPSNEIWAGNPAKFIKRV